ncbi:MAG TPA: toprim domain-containing protein, partial [Burkholderiaceae bacterium]|nr:toprim domain-containing protein [Burkholderiaceae bacterium]
QLAQWAENRVTLSRLFDAAGAITDACPAGIYLDRRGLSIPNSDALRFMPKLDYWHDGQLLGTFPAMLAAVTSPSGALVSVHRTYITPEGHKAPVPTVKKLMATAGPMAGTSIKIGAPLARPDGRLGLGVAEGIETALAASILSGVAVWSCVSAHGLEAFEPPGDVHYLYCFGDHDASGVGQKAASDLAHRAARSGLSARIWIPEAPGTDWNDELISRRASV